VRTVIESGYWESFGGEREVKRMKEQFREMLKLDVIDLQQPSTINLLGFFVTVGKFRRGTEDSWESNCKIIGDEREKKRMKSNV
jgi:hypothetical protein